jgi:hypothetical protein
MSAPNPLIAPATAISSYTDLNTTEDDKCWLYVTAALGAAETVDVYLPTTNGTRVVAIDPRLGTAYQLTTAVPSILLEGGTVYQIRKSATVGATGVDVQHKPRQGPH